MILVAIKVQMLTLVLLVTMLVALVLSALEERK